MNTKRFFTTLSLLGLLSLCACSPVESGPKVPSIPPETTSSESRVSSSEEASSVSPSLESSSVEDQDFIEVHDPCDHYYVGETFSKALRAEVLLHYNGRVQDISSRSSGVSYSLKDAAGKTVDVDAPFTKTGNYTYQIYLTKEPTIVSEEMPITVLASPSKKLTQKSILPAGFTYGDFEGSVGQNLSFLSKGDVPCLVIPLEFSDYPFASIGYGEGYGSAINTLFNGNGPQDTGYFESIASYYRKSSMNQLRFQFDIADVYRPGLATSDVISSGVGGAYTLVDQAVEAYKQIHGADSTKKYDLDHDGFLDGVWVLYSAPHYATGAYGSMPGSDLFWAFCSNLGGEANLDSPKANSFGWASASFMFEGCEAPKVDSHTFIHETGHLLSLPDYYSYDLNGVKASGAQGGLAMMDLNIGDQDSFSKMALGWANPYVAREDCLVTLKPNGSSGDSLILCDSWNGTAFDEYILLDFVTPEGLNALDSKTAYPGRPLYFSEAGVRMYHIDARLGEFQFQTAEESSSGYGGVRPIKGNRADYYLGDSDVRALVASGSLAKLSTDATVPLKDRAKGYTVINANSTTRALIGEYPYNNNRLIALVGADYKVCELDDSHGTNASLFRTGDCWTVNGKTLRNFSSTEGVFNNGDDFGFVVSVLSINDDGATIQIKKVRAE